MELLLDAGVDQFGGEECTDVLLDLLESGRVSEQRVDESAARLLAVKFRLGLFDDPFVDEVHAAATVGCGQFRREGLLAQARSVTVLRNETFQGQPALPLAPDRRFYLEGVAPAAVTARGGTVVDTPAEADVALVRLKAPFEPRSDLFLEAWFHQGSLDFPPGLASRLARVAAAVPLVLDVTLDRPAILTPLVELSSALVCSYGSSDDALLDALTGTTPPLGRLPFDIPRSMDDVRAHGEDVPGFADPLFAFGDGLELAGPTL